MLGRTNTGGGGGGLNFQVIGGTTAPSNPKENTIWINTSTAITFWTFQPLTPSNPQEGWVWINVGTSSTVAFNALKKNRIQVYPLSAKQYVSGAWVDKTAKSYQGGEWVEWTSELYLYNTGDECTAITGGWKTKSNSGYNATITKNAASIKIYSATSEASGLMVMKNTDPIDLTKFQTMLIVVLEKTGANSCAFGLVQNYSFSDFTSAWLAKKTITGKGTYELEIPIGLSEGLPLIQVGPSSSITFEILLLK